MKAKYYDFVILATEADKMPKFIQSDRLYETEKEANAAMRSVELLLTNNGSAIKGQVREREYEIPEIVARGLYSVLAAQA